MVEESINKENINKDSGEGTVFPKPAQPEQEQEDKITQANKAAERMEKANEELKKLLEKQEKLEASRILSGQTIAGDKTKPKEETPREYAEKIMRGENK